MYAILNNDSGFYGELKKGECFKIKPYWIDPSAKATLEYRVIDGHIPMMNAYWSDLIVLGKEKVPKLP